MSTTLRITRRNCSGVPANDRAGLERLCRYILRPLAHERLRLRADGRVQVDLKTAWHDGVRRVVGG